MFHVKPFQIWISFAKLYIEEVSKRLTNNLKINSQNMEFNEPYSLTNDQHVTTILNEDNSEEYWDELCRYYLK